MNNGNSEKIYSPAERKPQGGRPAKDNRQMVNAMLWIVRSGAPWRDLPAYDGPWQSVYTRFRRWEKAGVFEQMLQTLTANLDSESMTIDSTFIRVHQHGAGAKGGSIIKPLDDHVEGNTICVQLRKKIKSGKLRE